MKLRPSPLHRDPSRAGAALLLSLLVLFVLIAIVMQLNVGTSTDARVARNDVGLTQMDLAIESELLEVFETLKADAEADAAQGEAGGAGAAGGAGGGEGAMPGGGAEGGGGQPSGPVDSHEDEWGRPIPAEINEIELSVLVQDEDSKLNLLTMLVADEEEADKAYERVVRILDLCRENTAEDIDVTEAEDMATAMREHLRQRTRSELPRPALLTDAEGDLRDRGLPLTMREFVVLEPFEEKHFRDYYDEDGVVVHSIGAYLTIYTAPMTFADYRQREASSESPEGAGSPEAQQDEQQQQAEQQDQQQAEQAGQPGQGGGGAAAGGAGAGAAGGAGTGAGFSVNVNTAPIAVIKSLMDDRDVPYRFWDRVVEYRNEIDEERQQEEESSDTQTTLGQYYDEEVEPKQVFESLEQFQEIDGYRDLEPVVQQELDRLVKVSSDVFTIYVTARRSTAADGGAAETTGRLDRQSERERRMNSKALIRTVRCVVWRHTVDGEVQIVPLVRWEVIDYEPFEVLDYPEDR